MMVYMFCRGPLLADLADVDYCLLDLSARTDTGSSRARSGSVDGAFLAQLLAPGALTPDRLAYLPSWLLLEALQAIGALPGQTPQPEQASESALHACNSMRTSKPLARSLCWGAETLCAMTVTVCGWMLDSVKSST